ncbi:MAG: MotA/TolQ/ExbB proton channel family protein [Simkania sp.]|nr:MotA/TolQ/ExbB proton channel family protein [Simkania sp.]
MSNLFIASSSDVFFTAYAQSDVFGRLIILSLISLSLICWLILLQKAWQNREVRKLSLQFLNTLSQNKQPVLTLDPATLPKASTKHAPHPYATVLKALKIKTLEILEKNHYFLRERHPEGSLPPTFLSQNDVELIESHVITIISNELRKLEKHLYILSTIVTLAPFLGLLGTVWGILITFSGLHAGGSAASNTAILGGLSTALATTVLGLVIAIPALIAFNTLKSSVKSFSADLEDFSYQLLGQIQLEYRKVEVD